MASHYSLAYKRVVTVPQISFSALGMLSRESSYTDNSGIFGFYDIPYGTYDLRVSLGEHILFQRYIDDEGAETKTKIRPIEINKPRVKISEVIVSKEVIYRDYGKGYYNIVAKHSSQCLDVKGKSTEKGANVQQYPCSGGNNQLWKIDKK